MKKLVIDGHNLIPKIPGLHLNELDDETRLIERIQEYCRLARKQAELFFDGAPQTQSQPQKHGLVHVHFIKAGSSADDAIIQFVKKYAQAGNLIQVVSSDHRIQNSARASGCEVISSENFARMMNDTFSSDLAIQQKREKTLSESEVEEWIALFSKKKNS